MLVLLSAEEMSSSVKLSRHGGAINAATSLSTVWHWIPLATLLYPGTIVTWSHSVCWWQA